MKSLEDFFQISGKGTSDHIIESLTSNPLFIDAVKSVDPKRIDATSVALASLGKFSLEEANIAYEAIAFGDVQQERSN